MKIKHIKSLLNENAYERVYETKCMLCLCDAMLMLCLMRMLMKGFMRLSACLTLRVLQHTSSTSFIGCVQIDF